MNGLFSAIINEEIISTSENLVVRFSNFFNVNCPLMFYSVYSKSYVWKDINGDTDALFVWWPCACLKFILACEAAMKSFFFRSILVFDLLLNYFSDIKEGYWLQLLFYSLVLLSLVVFFIGMSLFKGVSGFRLKFSLIAFLREPSQLVSETGLITNELILGFLFDQGFFSLISYLHGVKCASIAQIWFSFDDIKSFRELVWKVFWSLL